jgi:hypothetical protein
VFIIFVAALELLVCAIQAYVFALLTTLYLNDADQPSLVQTKEFQHGFRFRSGHWRRSCRNRRWCCRVGVGNVFGSFLESALRNPGAADSQQGRLFIGFAAAELSASSPSPWR